MGLKAKANYEPLKLSADKPASKFSLKPLLFITLVVFVLFTAGYLGFFFASYKDTALKSFSDSSNIDATLLLPPKDMLNNGVFSDVPLHPTEYGSFEGWVFRYFQPTLLGFESDGAANYMIVQALDTKFKVFLTGTLHNVTVDNISLFKSSDSPPEFVNFEFFKSVAKIGSPINIEYISEYPSADIRNSEYCSGRAYMCNIAQITDLLEIKAYVRELPFSLKEVSVMPAYQIHLDILEK